MDIQAKELVAKAKSLSYPAKPSANGKARVNFCRRDYYFGDHRTDESFAVFGRWQARIIETGEVPETKAIRVDMPHIPGPDEDARKPARWGLETWHLVVAAILATASICGAFGAGWASRSTLPPVVDNATLDEEEVETVRGLRQHDSTVVDLKDDRSRKTRIAEFLDKIKDERPKDGIHTQTGPGSTDS